MIPLRVKVVVVVVEVGPPGVVVREDGGYEQDHHIEPDPTLDHQLQQILIALIQRNNSTHDQHPHFEAIPRRIKVHVLVGGYATLVGPLEHRVPAGAGAEAFVHVARVCLPEMPKDEDVRRHDNSWHYGTACNPEPGVRE